MREAKQSRRRQMTKRPRLEALEDRSLLSVSTLLPIAYDPNELVTTGIVERADNGESGDQIVDLTSSDDLTNTEWTGDDFGFQITDCEYKGDLTEGDPSLVFYCFGGSDVGTGEEVTDAGWSEVSEPIEGEFDPAICYFGSTPDDGWAGEEVLVDPNDDPSWAYRGPEQLDDSGFILEKEYDPSVMYFSMNASDSLPEDNTLIEPVLYAAAADSEEAVALAFCSTPVPGQEVTDNVTGQQVTDTVIDQSVTENVEDSTATPIEPEIVAEASAPYESQVVMCYAPAPVATPEPEQKVVSVSLEESPLAAGLSASDDGVKLPEVSKSPADQIEVTASQNQNTVGQSHQGGETEVTTLPVPHSAASEEFGGSLFVSINDTI